MQLPHEYVDLAARQVGVVSRAQLVTAGLTDEDLRRLLRRRLVARVHRGVFVDHTGQLSWRQRAWAAVLATGPAALDGPSALTAAGLSAGVLGTGGEKGAVHVAIDASRRVEPPAGVVVRRVRGLDRQVRWAASPPRLRLEEAVVLGASGAADDLTAVGILTDAVQQRHTTADRVLAAVAGRKRLARRELMVDVLNGLAHGAASVLEHAYLRRVEGVHGLPRAGRQATAAATADLRDVLYEAEKVIVELDGRAYHSLAADRYRDMERDAAAAAAGYVPLRFGWGQLFGTPCVTARRVAEVLTERGWAGRFRRCVRCPG